MIKHQLFICALLTLSLSVTRAASATWTGPTTGGEWNTAADWNIGVPAAGTNATINSGTTVGYDLPMAAASFGVLTNKGVLDVNTSGFNNNGIFMLNPGGTGQLFVNANGAVNVTGSLAFCSNSLVTMSAGSSLTISGSLLVGCGSTGGTSSGTPGGYGTLTNSGGNLVAGSTSLNPGNGSITSGALLAINGGTNNLGTVSIKRSAGTSGFSTIGTEGLVIYNGIVTMGSLNVGGGSGNSYLSTVIEGGVVTNLGNVTINQSTGGRGSRLLQTGGLFVVPDPDIVNPNPTVSASINIDSVTGGTNITGGFYFGTGTSPGSVYFTNAAVIYVGSQGIASNGAILLSASLNNGGVFGATANWTGSTAMILAGGTFTFSPVDLNGTGHTIILTGPLSGPGGLQVANGGTLVLSNANTYLGGTTIAAGSLVLGKASSLPTGTTLAMGSTGAAGTLDLVGFSPQLSSLATAGTAASQIITNSSPVNTSTLIFSNSAVSSIYGGVISGGSKPINLTDLGGDLTLSGQNNYAGNISINNGSLALSGAGSTFSGTSIVLSNSASMLDVSGMGGITLGAGQSLSGFGVITGSVTAANCQFTPGSTVGGTLSLSNDLTLNGGVTSQFDLESQPGTAGNSQIVVAGTLNLSGLNTVRINPLSGTLSTTTYHLITCSSVGSGDASNFQITTTPGSGLVATINVTATGVDLLVSQGGENLVWTGDGAANLWDLVSPNWQVGGAPGTFADGNFVVFDDTSTNPMVNLVGALEPAAVTVNAAVNNYTFTGTGDITGSVTLTKTNSGTLILLTTNDYNGVTTISQGTIQVGNGVASGALGIGSLVDNGLLSMQQPASTTLSNLISGTGSLTQAGTGTLTLAASNTYSGGTTISAGTLQIGSGGMIGSGNVTNYAALIFNNAVTNTINSVINGSGSLAISGGSTITLNGNDLYSGNTTVSSGTLLVNNAIGNGIVTVNSSGILGGSGTIGGSVTINSGGTLAPGNSIGTLAIGGNLTMNSGSIVDFALGTSNDLVTVGNNLNLNCTLNISNSGNLSSGTNTLFTYGGSLLGSSVTIGTIPLNTQATYTIDTSTPGKVNLIVKQTPLAFPGAQGFGRYATGGRGGSIYHVTNLSDSGTGSFRDAVSQANRIIVFDVGGYISLASPVSCSSSLTIAGQTAPGGGIGVMGHEVSFSVRSNDIVRYVRFRPGSSAATTEDGIDMGDGTNLIFDHISVEFAPYNSIDAHGNYTGGNQITIQNSILAEPIGQQFNAHTEATGNTFAWVNDIFSSGHDRNPLAKVNTIFVNNVVYNFQNGYTVAGTTGNFSHDIINNYFITGPASTSPQSDFAQMDENQSMYTSGNLLDSNDNGALDGSPTAPSGVTVLTSPWAVNFTPFIPTLSPASAYRYDVSQSGALPQDQIDQLVDSEVMSLGTAGQGPSLWSSQTQTGFGNSGFGVINGGTTPVDTDGSGMPDYWDVAMGLSTNNALNATNLTASGYTELESYLDWLAGPHVVATNYTMDVNLSQYAGGFTNVSPIYSVSGATNGTVTLLGDGQTAQFTFPPNYQGLGSFNFSVTGNDGTGMTNTVGLVVSALTLTSTEQPPIANPDSYSVNENSMTNVFMPLTNDVLETPGGTLSITAVSPTNGTATISGGTNVLFTPTTDFVGTATIGYTITDGMGGTGRSLITINVTGQAPPQIGPITISSGNFIMSGSGGIPGQMYYVLTSTNAALPLSQWTPIFTNYFDSNGNFASTNGIPPTLPSNFYLIQIP